MRIFIIQVHDPDIHLEVDEEQWAITQEGKRQAERTGFLAPYLSGLRHTDHYFCYYDKKYLQSAERRWIRNPV